MKVLFCTNAFENVTNGPAKFANLILEINRRYPQHQVRVLTEDVGEERLRASGDLYKVQLRIPRLLKPLGQFLRMFQYYRRVRAIAREYDYDLLVFNNAFTGLYASWVSPKPTVGMINDEKNLTAGWASFTPDRWWLKQFLFRQLERWSTRSHRLIIVNSEYLQRKVTAAYRVPAARVRRLYKAIDLSGTVFRPGRPFGSPVRVLFVKADYRVGQLALLIKALASLPEYQFALTVIGPEPRFRDHVLSLAAGVANVRLDCAGPQPQRVVYDCLGTHDLFCVPSRTEALGVANIEALAHGIPVVSTHVGGIPEVLDYGRNGWLAQPGDVGSLAAAIRECITDPAKRQRLSENGHTFVARFSKTEMLDQFVRILSL
jgi:glycosyltransferase involved in cell wall biosynthesis